MVFCAAPTINTNSLKILGSVQPASAYQISSSTQGDQVQFTGSNFGLAVASGVLRINYGPPADINRYSCSINVLMSSNSQITCSTEVLNPCAITSTVLHLFGALHSAYA